MNMKEVRQFLASAVKAGAKFEQTSPGGRGSYDFSYEPTYELEHEGHTLTLSDQWCGESQNSGYCYRQFISIGDFSCRLGRLDGVSKKLLDRIEFKSDQEIEKELGVE